MKKCVRMWAHKLLGFFRVRVGVTLGSDFKSNTCIF